MLMGVRERENERERKREKDREISHLHIAVVNLMFFDTSFPCCFSVEDVITDLFDSLYFEKCLRYQIFFYSYVLLQVYFQIYLNLSRGSMGITTHFYMIKVKSQVVQSDSHGILSLPGQLMMNVPFI